MNDTITDTAHQPAVLRRVLTLPWLVFYGLGVTIGAGIFALIGEILGFAGDAAPMAFLIAGTIAGFTGLSYALLVGVFPRAGGVAIYVNRGLGRVLGWIAGIGVVITGIISSAVIALAFAGYASAFLPLSETVLLVAVMAVLTAVAVIGVRESVVFAAVITLLEVGALAVVIIAGLPLLSNLPPIGAISGLSGGMATLAPALSAAVIAFFAFVGFEDIVNMAEETVEPARVAPNAIFWTLGATMVIYVALALVAISVSGRQEIVDSPAPLATLFETVAGLPGEPIAMMASLAMVNGILIQILMAARVLYGMSNEGLIPGWFAAVHNTSRTPVRATLFVSGIILVLALVFPLLQLAQMTSLVTLSVFALVNLSLFALGSTGKYERLTRWRLWGLAGAALCLGLIAFHLIGAGGGGH